MLKNSRFKVDYPLKLKGLQNNITADVDMKFIETAVKEVCKIVMGQAEAEKASRNRSTWLWKKVRDLTNVEKCLKNKNSEIVNGYKGARCYPIGRLEIYVADCLDLVGK